MKIIKDIKKDKIILIITHDKEVMKYCDKIILLENGKLVYKP